MGAYASFSDAQTAVYTSFSTSNSKENASFWNWPERQGTLNAPAVVLIDDFLIYVMEENHPDLVAEMKQNGSYEEVAWSVSCRAIKYCDLLNRQYAKQNPPPEDPDAYRSWKIPRDYTIDSAVMRKKVLVAVTTP